MAAHKDLESAVRIAESHWRAGNLERAYQTYQQILKDQVLLKRGPADGSSFGAADLVVMERTADLAVIFNEGEAADSLFVTIIQLSESAGNLFAADYARLKRIHLALQNSHYREAYEMLQGMDARIGKIDEIRFVGESLSAWEDRCQWTGTGPADRLVLFTQLYLAMGKLFVVLGQYKDGAAAFRRGLVHCNPQAPNLVRQHETPLKLGLAGALIEFGELFSAEEILNHLQGSLDENRSPGHFVQWMELLGRLDLLRGALGKARAIFEKVCEFCELHNLEMAKLRSILNLAHVLIFLNHTSRAHELLSGVEHHPFVKDVPTLSVRTKFLMNMALVRASSLTDGVPLATSVTQLWQNLPRRDQPVRPEVDIQGPLDLPQADNYLSFFEERCLAFYWLLGNGDIEFAARYFENIRIVFSLSDSYLIHTRLEILNGVLAYYQGKYSQAEAIFKVNLSKLQEIGLRPEQWQLLRFLGWCGARLGQSQAEQQSLVQDADQLLAEMTGSLEPRDQVIFLLNKWTEEETWLAGEINLLSALKSKYSRSPWWLKPLRWWQMAARLNHLTNRIEQYKDKRVQQTVMGHVANAKTARARGLIERLVKQSRDDLTLSFLVLPDRIFIVGSGWLAFDFGVSPMTRMQLRDLVSSWHRHYAWSFSKTRHLHTAGRITAKDRAAGELAKQIPRQLVEALQLTDFLNNLPSRIRKISIIPDDSLHGFPFAVLPYGDEFLIERFAIRIAFDQKPQPAQPKALHQALLVGISQGGGRLNNLPGVKKELNSVQNRLTKMHAQIMRLEDRSAAKQRILEELAVSSYFHIACHGIFEQNTPDRSGLVLDPSSQPAEILSLRELSKLDLRHIRHATLSSCWSADYFVLPGRWVISLPETLKRAGVQSVLGALWVVNDEVAAAFMDRFYMYLNETDRAEALRRVQLECLRGQLPGFETDDLTSPAYWGGFNLYGDDSKLR